MGSEVSNTASTGAAEGGEGKTSTPQSGLARHASRLWQPRRFKKKREAPPLTTQRWDVAQTGTSGKLKQEAADTAQRGDSVLTAVAPAYWVSPCSLSGNTFTACLLPIRHPPGTGHTQNTSTGEFWVGRRKMSVAGMWHSPPTLARVWGTGDKRG